jgi:hypothetical protein
MSDRDQSGGSWTLLTGHGRVLVEIGRDPGARIRDISAVVGLTERTVQVIVADLEAAGYLTRSRAGRRTRYTVNHDSLFRHPAQEGQRVGPFLSLLAAADEDARTTPEPDDTEIGWQQTLRAAHPPGRHTGTSSRPQPALRDIEPTGSDDPDAPAAPSANRGERDRTGH